MMDKETEKTKVQNYRGGIFDQIDTPAIISFFICLLLFILLILGVHSIDYKPLEKATLDNISDRVAKILVPQRLAKKKSATPLAKSTVTRNSKNHETSSPSGTQNAALNRIERSRKSVQSQITHTQERITKAAVLNILSGSGPGTQGPSVGHSRKSNTQDEWGNLDQKLNSIEGLTKVDAKHGSINRDGYSANALNEDEAKTSAIEHLAKGFKNAKVSSIAKIGSLEVEKPEILGKSARYTGNRDLQEVAAFIGRNQGAVSLLYEEKLKINPSLEGKITLVITIEADGRVSTVRILNSETTLNDTGFQNDLIRRIKSWVFPPATGGPLEMKSPFIFKPV